MPKKPTISQSGQIYSKTNINYDLKIACNKISVDYQIISLDSQGYFFISNPDAMLLLIKRFIRESNYWSIRRDVSRPNSSPNIFNFLFTTLFILPLNICLHTSQCFCLVEPSDKTLKKWYHTVENRDAQLIIFVFLFQHKNGHCRYWSQHKNENSALSVEFIPNT